MWRNLYKLKWSFTAPASVRNRINHSTNLPSISKTPCLPACLHNAANGQHCSNNHFACGKSKFRERARRGYNAGSGGYYSHLGHNILEAFGWGGIIFFSWYLCFPWCRKRISPNPVERYVYTSLDYPKKQQYACLGRSIANFILNTPATYIVPAVNAVKAKTENDNLAEGCRAIEEAHMTVVSSISNMLGTENMLKGHYDEAYSHFTNAAQHDNAAAIFNIGLCHELGLGTAQNFKKAAAQYRRAADLGHATAMYNLGVFYVHGWGGLEPDSETARSLFISAAQLGQPEATDLLHWPETENSKEPSNNLESDEDDLESNEGDLTDSLFKILNINIDGDLPLDLKKERLLSGDSGVDDLAPINDLDIVFSSIGSNDEHG